MAIIKNKAVVKLGLNDDKSKKAAKRALVDVEGFTSYTLDIVKSTSLVNKLRKFVNADLVMFGPEKDEGKSQKNNGDGGKVDQQPPQKQQPQKHQPQKHQQPPFDYGKRTSDYGYGYGYGYE